MLIGKRCTVCHDSVETDETVVCDACGKTIHERCADYETEFECPECASDLEIGAVEF